MKADAKFSRYSEREWREIDAELARLSGNIDKVELRDRLEQLGRECVAPTVGMKQLKFLNTKERQVAQFRRQVIEAGQLPQTLKGRAAELVGEIERLYQDRAAELYWAAEDWGYRTKSIEAGPGWLRVSYTVPPAQNAQLPHIDRYFDSLITVWESISDDWLWPGKSNVKPFDWLWPGKSSNVKPLRAFIAACARPVIGRRSTTERAIGARLRRLDVRMGRLEHKRASS